MVAVGKPATLSDEQLSSFRHLNLAIRHHRNRGIDCTSGGRSRSNTTLLMCAEMLSGAASS